MNLSCLIIDDQSHVIELVSLYVERTDDLSLVGAETDPISALRLLQSGELRPDIVFLDIDMPDLPGTILAGMIKDITGIIFMTAHRQYGPEAFEVNAIDYLLKPVSYPRFLESIDKARYVLSNHRKARLNSPFFFTPESDRNLVKIEKANIIYIEGSRNYLWIHQINQKQLSRASMQQMEAHLSQPDFFRIHRSYIINTAQIKELGADLVTMSNGEQLPISTTYRQAFQQWIAQQRP
jgi:DNA-binding LytR/AlgR family response regulator